jgi:hypothetical protein
MDIRQSKERKRRLFDMVNTIYGISLLLAFVTGFLVAIKSVQLGLKWQIQTAKQEQPELQSPIQPFVEAVQQKQTAQANNLQKEVIKEWLYGDGK